MLARNVLLSIGVLAILIGALVAGVLAFRPHGNAGSQSAAGQAVAVLVAARPVPAGGLLREEDLAWRPMGAQLPPAGSLTRDKVSEAQYVGAVARRGFLAGEIVLDSAVIAPNDRRFLAAVLSPGTRAVTMPVDEAQSAAGLILPDDRIDVILVREAGGASTPGQDPTSATAARILLHAVRVVAVDRAMERPPPAATASSALPRTITMELSDIDAQRLFLAQQIGSVHLTVRALARPLVELAQIDQPVSAADLFANGEADGEIGGQSPHDFVDEDRHMLDQPSVGRAVRPPAPATAPPPPPEPIVILRGSKVAAP